MSKEKKVVWIRIDADVTADLLRVIDKESGKDLHPDRIIIDMVRGHKISVKIEAKDEKPKTYEAEEFFANAQIRRRRGPKDSSGRKGEGNRVV